MVNPQSYYTSYYNGSSFGALKYSYCNNNPINLIDPTGMAWKPTMNENTGEYTGYSWIDPSESYNDDGTLKQGLYEQAIFFSDNGTFNSNSSYNMGSSTATVYKADGTTTTFDACTNPSSSSYATVPAGLYQAAVGTHNGSVSSYTALQLRDVGATDRTIELGMVNPNSAYSDGRTYAENINIHKPGKNNLTGMSGKNPISAGCLLIDRNSWSDFIGIFNTDAQRNNTISVTVSRTMATPTNQDVKKPYDYIRPDLGRGIRSIRY